jgi:hypothetical protein
MTSTPGCYWPQVTKRPSEIDAAPRGERAEVHRGDEAGNLIIPTRAMLMESKKTSLALQDVLTEVVRTREEELWMVRGRLTGEER